MKKTLFLGLFLTLISFFGIGTASATGGACSDHGGVMCSIGADTDGSVICLDGWRGSSVDYVDMQDDCGTEYVEPDANASEVFPDVAVTNKNRDAILYLYTQSIISGYPDGSFKPANDINRAELLKILVEGTGQSPDANQYKDCFSDVHDDWYAKYVCYGKNIGWIDGYPDGSYKPSQTVNKVEAIKMILNSQGIDVPVSVSVAPFSDVPTDAWFASYVSKAKELRLLEETGTTLRPSDMMQRASVSEIMYRALILFIVDVEPEATIETAADVQPTMISLSAFWENWDGDAEEDGSKVSAYFKDDNGDLVYPTVQDWTIIVKVYNKEMVNYEYIKSDLLYGHTFTGNDVKYETILGVPFVRVPKEEIEGASDKYGYIEATFSSPTYGEFSAYDNFVQIGD